MQVGKTEPLDDNFERRIRALEIATFGADGTKPLPYNVVQELRRHAPAAICINDMPKVESAQAKADRYAAALRAIVARADDSPLITTKEQDMRRIAVEAVGDE